MATPISETAEYNAPGAALKRALIFFSVMWAGAVYGSATTVANVVLPHMQGDLSASLDQVAWIVTASVVAAAIGTPPTPWIAARFGAKQLLMASLIAFTLSSAMIGFSTSLLEVVVWRIIQAVTGAPILVLSQTFTLSTYPEEKRGPVLAIWSIGLTCGWVFAPAIGAYVADQQTWRLIFWVMAPLGISAAVLCGTFVPRTRNDEKLSFDWTGFIALSIALAGLQIILNRGQRLDWFESPQILFLLGLSLIALYFFVVHSMTTKNPFFKWEVFKDRNLAVGVVLTFSFAFISLTPLVLLPSMLEQLRGLDTVTVGFMLVPEGVVELIALLIVAQFIGRIDSRLLISFGFLLYAAGAWLMSNFNFSIGLWDVIIPLCMQGGAMAIIWLPVFHMLYSTLDTKLHTEAAAMVGLAYSISSSAGIAISVTLLSRTTQTSTEELATHVIPTNEVLRLPEHRDWALDSIEGLAAIQAEVAAQAQMIGYVNIYWLLTIICLVAAPIAVIFGSSGRAGNSSSN